MSEQEYEDLWHYSEQFSRDPLQRSELVTMAWKEGVHLGQRSTLGLQKSVMHFRSKELNKRAVHSLQKKWANERLMRGTGQSTFTWIEPGIVADFLLSEKATPYDHAVCRDFLGSLTTEEQDVLDDLNAGFKRKEICQRQSITDIRLNSLQYPSKRKPSPTCNGKKRVRGLHSLSLSYYTILVLPMMCNYPR